VAAQFEIGFEFEADFEFEWASRVFQTAPPSCRHQTADPTRNFY
jgi:hypothetical protein